MFALPPYLEVRYTTDYGRGIFAKKPIKRGTKLLTGKVYAIGVGGVTVDDVRVVCHHCFLNVPSSQEPIVCKECGLVSYCSTDCLRAGRPLHAMECKGIKELENSRGKVNFEVEWQSWPPNYTRHWPPVHALLVARVINMGILGGSDSWINNACYAGTLPPAKSESFTLMEKYVRPLVPSYVSNHEIKRAFRVISVNTSGLRATTEDTSVVAVYNIEYLLLNHMCKPNCESEPEEDGSCAVFAMDDLKAGEQLGVSYLLRDYCLNFRDIRRAKLMQSFGFDCNCFVCRGEVIAGSKQWLLERRKHSLIAPWSPEMALDTMQNAWELLCKGRITPNITPPEIIALLEPTLKSQELVLAKHNVMLILTTITLILNYNIVRESQKAVDLFTSLGQAGTCSIIEYGHASVIAEVMGAMCVCLLDLRRMEEFRKAFSLAKRFHHKAPSPSTLRQMLGITPALTTEEWKVEDERAEEEAIFSALYEEFMIGLLLFSHAMDNYHGVKEDETEYHFDDSELVG